MSIRDLFEIKKKDENMYRSIVRLKGNTPQYSKTNYAEICKQGYSGNFAMFRCMQEILKACLQIEWKVMKINDNGEEEEVKNHPILEVLRQPNPLYSGKELIKRAVAFYYIGGEAPFHKIETIKGVRELYVYRPDRIKFNNSMDINYPYKDITYEGMFSKVISPENFFLWKNFDPLDDLDGLGHGLSLLSPILKNGDLLNAMLDWNTSMLQNGGSLSGVISTPEILEQHEYDRAKESISNNHQGKGEVGKFLFLDGGATFTSTSATPKDMDWNEGKDSTIQDICIGMGVDPILIGFNEHSSYNNKKEAEKGLLQKTAIPLMQELGAALTNFLKLENEYIDITYSHIPALGADVKELSEALSKSNDMTINEKRAVRGLEPIKGGDILAPNDVIIVNGNIYAPGMKYGLLEEKNGEEKSNFMY